MRPYDWCDPRCPNTCSCEEQIKRQIEEDDKCLLTPGCERGFLHRGTCLVQVGAASVERTEPTP